MFQSSSFITNKFAYGTDFDLLGRFGYITKLTFPQVKSSNSLYHLSFIITNYRLNNFSTTYFSVQSRSVSCLPKADALNPCEDLMGWVWLRISVWFVLSTAIIGNMAVLIVLTFTRTEKSVPRFLMCNLAFADLLMAMYLMMLAFMDIISSQVYFNYAYDWQRGMYKLITRHSL